ncbi:MAG: HPr(Ser) kinase/phosphatase [Beduini sp.]|uniref:HPr(Ser) kinase/phosphatase n=1 Tax=Beduini sp. TaxID=1922300 RepID=UPI0039A09BD1
MSKKSVLVKVLTEHYPSLIQATGDETSLDREILVPEINRPGFELAGFFQHSDFRRVVVFGEKEMAFIDQMTKEEQVTRFERLTDDLTPVIVIAKNYQCPPILKEIADKKNFPIMLTAQTTGRFSVELSAFLDEKLAPETLMHGVFLNIYGKGVIIKGDSGIGKSEIALELVKRGHLLVADDAVELYQIGQQIIGKSPTVLQNLLEIRGIGVIDVVKMFGVGAVLEKDQVDMIIQLERWVPSKEYTRIGIEDKQVVEDILGVEVDKLVVPVTGGRNMSVVIEAAVMNKRLKELGYDSSKEFVDRILANIENGKGNQN